MRIVAAIGTLGGMLLRAYLGSVIGYAGWFGYQPALMPLSASSALAVLRNDDSSNVVSTARTEDGGLTWSTPQPLDLPNADAGLDAVRLSDGRLLLAFNDSKTGRENLRLALSVEKT